MVYWFTGLSGAGKSTLVNAVAVQLYQRGYIIKVLDGDIIRQGLCSDLGFSLEDRQENIRRIAEVAKLFMESGVIVLCAFITPTETLRDQARDIVGADRFKQIYIKCPLEVCESRDVKGLYAKARQGKIVGFTGIDSPYEEPAQPDIILDTAQATISQCVQNMINLIIKD